MKYFILLLSAFLSGNFCMGQQWNLGVKAGLTVPNLRSPDDPGTLNSGYKSILGFEGGLIAERKINKLISIQTELIYTTSGGVRRGVQRLKTGALKQVHNMLYPSQPLPPYLYADFENKVVLKYVSLPVMMKLNWKVFDKGRFSVMGGPFIAMLQSAKNIAIGEGKLYFDPQQTQEYYPGIIKVNADSTITDLCNTFNYGIQGGISLSYAVSKWELGIFAGGNYGLAYLQKDSQYGKNQTGAVTATFAIVRRF